jgi:hypothetical protein
VRVETSATLAVGERSKDVTTECDSPYEGAPNQALGRHMREGVQRKSSTQHTAQRGVCESAVATIDNFGDTARDTNHAVGELSRSINNIASLLQVDLAALHKVAADAENSEARQRAIHRLARTLPWASRPASPVRALRFDREQVASAPESPRHTPALRSPSSRPPTSPPAVPLQLAPELLNTSLTVPPISSDRLAMSSGQPWQRDDKRVSPRIPVTAGVGPRRLGLEVNNCGDGPGVRVLRVDSDGAADAAGVTAGDVITAFNGTLVARKEDFKDAFVACTSRSAVITVVPGGRATAVPVQLTLYF